MLTVDELLRTLESREDEIATLCAELVQRPTPNPPGDTAACAAHIQRYFEAYGVPTSWASVRRVTVTCPVSMSTSTSATHTEKE